MTILSPNVKLIIPRTSNSSGLTTFHNDLFAFLSQPEDQLPYSLVFKNFPYAEDSRIKVVLL